MSPNQDSELIVGLHPVRRALETRPREEFPSYEKIEALLGPVKVVTDDKPKRRRRR